MFLFNRLKIDTIKDQKLLDKMKKWFNISSTNYASQPTLLESKRRMLDELEIEKLESFEFDFNYSQNPVQVSKRLIVTNATYHTQDYNRTGNKRCNYAVKYRGENNLFEFGIIKYFLKINNLVLVAVNNFKIVGNIITKIGGRTSNALIGIKNSGVFNRFFAEVKEINNIIFIDAKKLNSKCILGRTEKKDTYLISEFIIDDEHE